MNTLIEEKPDTSLQTSVLPPWKLILHNDDGIEFKHVVEHVVKITPLDLEEADKKAMEAHNEGLAILLATNRERGELYVEQFHSCLPPIPVTLEPA